MATIDDTRNVLVVRIVYDGPALSGKTTSLQALARGVSSTVETPGETDGRTLFFDWVDYVGGLFEGRQIRCQIVSVPGQRELHARRRLLVDSADAVVLVLDTRASEWKFGLGWLAETLPICRAKEPPVGVVLQANKRDEPDAVPRTEINESLRRFDQIAVVESSAKASEGIREAFVLAVRLALDRVRALSAAGDLKIGKPREDDSKALLERMLAEAGERSAPLHHAFSESMDQALHNELEPWPSSANPRVRPSSTVPSPRPSAPPPRPSSPPRSSAPPPPSDEREFVPDPMMPGGMIWPPVDGRALLHEVASLGIRPSRTRHANWSAAGSGFRFYSVGTAIYSDPGKARNELIEWARLHAANSQLLSTGRAVILGDAGDGRLRLWQLVRADTALRERLATAMVLPEPVAVARDLADVATRLAASRDAFRAATIPLPCTLWTVGVSSSYKHAFVGLMPSHNTRLGPELDGQALFEREFSPHLRDLRRTRVDYRDVVRRVRELADAAPAESALHWFGEVVTAA